MFARPRCVFAAAGLLVAAHGCRKENPDFGADIGAETTVDSETTTLPATTVTTASGDATTQAHSGSTSIGVTATDGTTTHGATTDDTATNGTTTDGGTSTGSPGCAAGDTGWVSPTLQEPGGAGDGFEVDPAGALADGGAFAANLDSPGDAQLFHGFDLSVPDGCAVRGVELRADWWVSDDVSGSNLRVVLSTDGGATFGQANTDTMLTLAEHTVVFGSPLRRWFTDWDTIDLAGDQVWLRVRATGGGSVDPQSDTYLDWVAIRVHYGEPVNETGALLPTSQLAGATGDGDGFEVAPTGTFDVGGVLAEDVDSGTGGSTECGSPERDSHRFSAFGLDVPAGSTVHGVVLRANGYSTGMGMGPGYCFRLSWDGGTQFTEPEQVDLTSMPQMLMLGAEDFGWGRVWQADDLGDANFQVEVFSRGNGTSRDFFLDYLTVDVSYEP